MRRDVDVMAIHLKSGRMIPQYIIWDENTFYEIESVTDICQPKPRTAVFTCIVSGKEVHLYLDNKNKFYVETA